MLVLVVGHGGALEVLLLEAPGVVTRGFGFGCKWA